MTFISLTIFTAFIILICFLLIIKDSLIVCASCGKTHLERFHLILDQMDKVCKRSFYRQYFYCNGKRCWFYRDYILYKNQTRDAALEFFDAEPWIMTYVNPVSERALKEAAELHTKLL